MTESLWSSRERFQQRTLPIAKMVTFVCSTGQDLMVAFEESLRKAVAQVVVVGETILLQRLLGMTILRFHGHLQIMLLLLSKTLFRFQEGWREVMMVVRVVVKLSSARRMMMTEASHSYKWLQLQM